ncbi:response regulator transcription factor [Pontibacter cellulosilyticus]|uniref:Response regulator n=1 Tax=Pontibacter cellulosilyticus TaxID=1720253 RepID=A0A923SJ11_9BACT|nr:response regulator [Pontibacter cellulosilyticus]MBC5993172.1 response regulator [Pontibacter cellulosilyticus]
MKTSIEQLKVLLVDDAPSILLPLEYLMRKSGFNVFIARNGTEAIECVNKELPQVVVLDIMMPDVDGYQVCQYIRSKKEMEGAKVIFLSARMKEVDIARGYETGADLYIPKPFSPRFLMEKIVELAGS